MKSAPTATGVPGLHQPVSIARRARARALGVAWLLTVFVLALTVSAHAQTATAKPATQKPAATAPRAPSGVDTVIALVKGGMSESLVISTLRREGKPYTLSTADLLKLSNAGVSEGIINAMMDPGTGAAAPAAAPAAASAGAPAAARGGATPFPPDLADVPAATKRRLAVQPFDYSTVTTWVNYWFNNNTNIGEGIRAMLTVRMNTSKTITLLERSNLNTILQEQDLGASNRVKKGTNAKIGNLSGADAILMGDIVIFGRDDTTKRKGLGAALGRFSPVAGAVATMNKEEKAVVGINLRIVDAETGEVIETAEARGESSRSSKDYAGVLGVRGAGAVAGSSGMTSSNFQETIIGEATSNAVTSIVTFLEGKIPSLPAKARDIDGRVASASAGSVILNVGTQDGVLRGDRFEILQINGEIKDPTTKEVIDIDAVKIGEFVADGVREKTTSGAYGGQPLSAAYVSASGKGYAARLVSK